MTKQQGCNHTKRTHFAKAKLSAAVLGLTSAIWANGLAALGLGDIDLNSALNERLDAEIQLLEVRDLTEAEIIIALAEQDAFDRQGIDRSYFLTNIEFDIDLNASGGPVVRLSSDQPVREPFLEFIISARWPSGKLMREYTVLLDLPVYAEDAPAPVAPVQTETVSRQPTQQSSSTASNTSSSSTYNNPRSSFDGGRTTSVTQTRTTQSRNTQTYAEDSYRVQREDTLWEIALDVRPDSSVSVHQTMIALHRANPEAFINGNINLLKSGKVLRVPQQDEIRALNNQDAVRQVARHNEDWQSNDMAAPLEASNTSLDNRVEQNVGEGRLSLISPEESSQAQAGRASGASTNSSSDASALKRELAATQETLDKTRGENQDLQSKIDSLEDQIQTLESMIQISNESLRAMELAAAQGDVVVETADPIAAADEDANAVSESDEAEDAVVTGTDDAALVSENEGELVAEGVESDGAQSAEELAPAVEQTETETAKEAKDPSKVVYSAPKKESGLFDLIKEYFLFIALGFLAIVAAVYFFFKKREDEEEYDDFLDNEFDYEEKSDEENDLVEDAVAFDEAETEVESELESEDVSDAVEQDQEDLSEPETEDVVAESDIYIAYGKYDQAEEMLVKALNAQPEYHEARLKLLEVYAAQGNVDAFDPNYAELSARGASDSMVSRAEALRENIAGAAPFDESMYQTGEFDSVSPDDAQGGEDNAVEFAEELSDDLDLDLGDDDHLKTELNLDAIDLDSETEASDEVSDIEFDLSDDNSSPEASDDISIDLSEGADADSGDDGIDFNLEDIEFDNTSDSSLEDDLSDIDNVVAAEGIDIAEDFDISDETVSSDEDAQDEAIEFDLSDLDGLSDVSETIEADVSSIELSDEEAVAPSLQDELDTDLGAIDFDLDSGADASEEPAQAETAEEGSTQEDSLHEESASEESVLEETDSDETDESNELDDLANLEDDLDLESLDAELDELSADLGDVDLEKESDDFAALDEDLGDSPSIDQVDEPESSADDLDATLEEGEQILAELDDDNDEGDESGSEVPMPAFEEFDADDNSSEEPTLISNADEFESFDELDEQIESVSTAVEEDLSESNEESSSSSENETLEFELPDIDPEASDDTDLDFLSSSDETSTKLDLAAAYVDMGDISGAKEIIEEVLAEGSDEQKTEANALLEKLNG